MARAQLRTVEDVAASVPIAPDSIIDDPVIAYALVYVLRRADGNERVNLTGFTARVLLAVAHAVHDADTKNAPSDARDIRELCGFDRGKD